MKELIGDLFIRFGEWLGGHRTARYQVIRVVESDPAVTDERVVIDFIERLDRKELGRRLAA